MSYLSCCSRGQFDAPHEVVNNQNNKKTQTINRQELCLAATKEELTPPSQKSANRYLPLFRHPSCQSGIEGVHFQPPSTQQPPGPNTAHSSSPNSWLTIWHNVVQLGNCVSFLERQKQKLIEMVFGSTHRCNLNSARTAVMMMMMIMAVDHRGPFSKFTLVDWFNSNHKMFHFSYSTEEDCEQSEIDQFFQRVPDRKRGKQLGQYCFFGMTRAGD
jgi:hypothetical protein